MLRLCRYAGAFVIACVSCILSGDGQAALKFLFQAAAEGGIMKPVQMIFQIMFLSFVGFSGVSVVLNLVKEFGAVVRFPAEHSSLQCKVNSTSIA
eukprot:SAG31_NODE_295_length_18239_cov_15.063065_7_plen_95_part_00